MNLPVQPPYPPMEAYTKETLPEGEAWQYEPKWDGFRCLVFRDGDEVKLQSKATKPLGRYFPEVVEMVRGVGSKAFVLDAELIVHDNGGLSFDSLLQRIHPAASRIGKLAEETPAELVVFDYLVTPRRTDLTGKPLAERRKRLEDFFGKTLSKAEGMRLSAATGDLETARGWAREAGEALDGLIAKDTTLPYRPGERAGMQKIKFKRTADCVVGGFRYSSKGKTAGSMLLGLYGEDGLLHHVGYTTASTVPDETKELTKRLEGLIGEPGFSGAAPGGPSRWATERSSEWKPLRPELVAEVEFDHFSGGRFRHGTKFLRWRPDKAPKQCGMKQAERESGSILFLLK